MGKNIDLAHAGELLEQCFVTANKWHAGSLPSVDPKVKASADAMFSSSTQSYRETILGCGLAHLTDSSIDITKPYVAQGENAFSGRTLDEKVVNPFLQRNLIPCSKGPYLATFRRNVAFIPETGLGLKDTTGYEAFLHYINFFQRADEQQAKFLLTYLLYRFLVLREQFNVPISRIARLSVEQLTSLITSFLAVPSGGLIPVLIVVATLETIKNGYGLPWDISRQGINESDAATGAGGDVTVRVEGEVLLAIEVTERPIGRERVIATFNTKIVPNGLKDYLFAYTDTAPAEEAKSVARGYFAQGHEVNFLQIAEWVVNILISFGAQHRQRFIHVMADELSKRTVPVAVKLAWNNIITKIVNQ